MWLRSKCSFASALSSRPHFFVIIDDPIGRDEVVEVAGEVRPTVDSQDEVGLNLASLVITAPIGPHGHDERQVIAIHIAQHHEHGVLAGGAVAEHHGMLHQLGQALHLLNGESMAVGVVAALRSDGIAQVALGVEHRQRAEPGLHEQLRRIAELDRAGTGILPRR